ncbi:monocarboxylate transporter 9 [Bombina bombina]|uniref:monocarboxylate transporter 9 n=1 Tax=Bombina bombina TaxID=8345 RepID=UPI00235ADA2B|nr:monocarboxylate transporter 9 [Bombina bombina]
MTFQKPPDGGWGWVIVVISFFIQLLCYGSPLAVGVLYVEWLDIFNEGKGKTAWVGSLAAGVGLLACPLCSASVSSFGVRPITIFSGFLVAGGLMMSSFAPSLYFLYFSYGIMVGIGCGLLYTATITVTCQYFEKRRGLALGIISTGSSVGTFIYAGLQKELICLYGLDGCLLIIGALSLNIFACGILMRPLQKSSSAAPGKPCLENVPDTYLIYHEKELNMEENLGVLEKKTNKELIVLSNTDCKQESFLNKHGFTILQEKSLVSKGDCKQENILNKNGFTILQQKSLVSNGDCKQENMLNKNRFTVLQENSLVSNGDFKKENILNKNGFIILPSTEKDNLTNNSTDAHICTQFAKNNCLRYVEYWGRTTDLFKNKIFSALFVAILLLGIGGFAPSLLLEDVAKSSNIDPESMIVPLVSITGFMMAIGKLVLGFLADFKWINTLYLYVLTLLGTGVVLIAVPFAKSYPALAILAALLGFLSGNWSIFPYVTTNTVGLDKLTHAYGILMFFAGLGNCLGPPLFGWIFDWVQTYDIAFYFSGLCVLFGGIFLLVVALPHWDTHLTKKSGSLQKTYSCKGSLSI